MISLRFAILLLMSINVFSYHIHQETRCVKDTYAVSEAGMGRARKNKLRKSKLLNSP